jgi:hypothetical protein
LIITNARGARLHGWIFVDVVYVLRGSCDERKRPSSLPAGHTKDKREPMRSAPKKLASFIGTRIVLYNLEPKLYSNRVSQSIQVLAHFIVERRLSLLSISSPPV